METPDEFICPITLEIMSDPVLCNDGYTYEKNAILQIRGSHSPMTRELIDKTKLIPNRALKNTILRYIEEKQKAELEKIEKVKLEAEKKAQETTEQADKKSQKVETYSETLMNNKIEHEIANSTKHLKTPSLKHMFYLTSSISEISDLLEGKINHHKKIIKTILYDFYDKIHSVDIDTLEMFNESLKVKIKYLESFQIIDMNDLIELFSIINIDGSFLLLFDQDYKNIRLVLFEFSKLIKYMFVINFPN
jgi:hypothetical protein